MKNGDANDVQNREIGERKSGIEGEEVVNNGGATLVWGEAMAP